MIFAGVYYSTQRLLKARMAHDALSRVHFWGWQAIIVAAAVTLPLGFTQGKEYAELEWPIDIAIAAVWVVFAVNFFWTLAKRRERQLYVAIWFYIATLLAIAVLHIVNSLAVPVSLLKSYSLFGGVQDALVQWWYGHNAVAFFLTTPILGIMYYFLPKAAERPVFSYRLSILHFWGLVFLYIWAGPHHLLNTALPDWAQTLGMVFSLMLWAPSWGGMINGLLTLRGAWDKLRTDPVLKFFAAAVTFYGMSTFEGPLLSIKAVSGIAHYTDWIIAHVHAGGLGWNGFMAAGMFYWLVPRLYGTKLRSVSAANAHFYTATFGILLYIGSMWAAGVQQGLEWMEMTDEGGFRYTFLETVVKLQVLYWARLLGGTIYLLGFVVMAWNLVVTARAGQPVDVTVEVPAAAVHQGGPSWVSVLTAPPVLLTAVVTVLVGAVALVNALASVLMVILAGSVAILGMLALRSARSGGQANGASESPTWHTVLEGRALLFTVLTVVAVLVGGVLEILPMLVTHQHQVAVTENVPYDALELEGRDVYLAEGCYTCHSQMVRPFVWEVNRYHGGRPSSMDDSVFDHPFQWGSKRTGPDLSFEGRAGKDNNWHYLHMIEPTRLSPGSVMPPYPHLVSERVNYGRTADKMRSLRAVGGTVHAAGDCAGGGGWSRPW